MYNSFFGMYAYWWIFWVFLWVMFFSFMRPMRRSSYRQLQSPLQLLQGRSTYAGAVEDACRA
jgi:putative membrane protein